MNTKDRNGRAPYWNMLKPCVTARVCLNIKRLEQKFQNAVTLRVFGVGIFPWKPVRGYASSRFSAVQMWSHPATIKSISVLQIRNYVTFATKNEFSNSQLPAIRHCLESRNVTCTAPEALCALGRLLPDTNPLNKTQNTTSTVVRNWFVLREVHPDCGGSPTHRLKRQV